MMDNEWTGNEPWFRTTLDPKQWIFDDIADLNKLQMIEDELWERQEVLDAEEVKEALIRLYRRMWEVDAAEDKTRYERSIARLLLEVGTDLKLNQLRLNKARKYFRELIEWQRPAPVPIAHYRLGFIAYTQRRWDQAISQLRHALGGMRDHRTPAEPWARLSRSQELRANVALTLAYEHMRKRAARRVRKLYGDGAGLDETDRYWYEQLADAGEDTQTYACIGRVNTRHLGERELRELIDQDDVIVLDCIDRTRERLWVSGTSYPISGRNLDVLRYLLGKSIAATEKELKEELGLRQPPVYILRLRQFLADCGVSADAIQSERGYKWVRPNTYMVIRSDNPEYLFGII